MDITLTEVATTQLKTLLTKEVEANKEITKVTDENMAECPCCVVLL